MDSLSGGPSFVSHSGGFVIPVVQGSWIKMLAMMPARRTWAPHPLLPRGSFIVGKVTPDSSAVRSPCWPGKWACCMVLFNHMSPWSSLVESYHGFGRSASGQHSHAAERRPSHERGWSLPLAATMRACGDSFIDTVLPLLDPWLLLLRCIPLRSARCPQRVGEAAKCGPPRLLCTLLYTSLHPQGIHWRYWQDVASTPDRRS